MTGDPFSDALSGAAAKAFATPFGAVLMMAPEEGAPLWIDGRHSPPRVLSLAPSELDAGCVWRGAREALLRVLSTNRAFESSLISGRVTVAGDMSVMARITLEDVRA